MVHTAVLRVRIEPGIPKLLVKINPQDAEAFQAKNLGEVTLRKGSGSRSQVAVLHMSRGTANGEVLMSVKLADLLDLEDGEGVEVAAAAASQGPMPRRAAPTETGQREQPRPQPSLWEAKPRPSLDPKEWFRSLEKEQEMRARLNGHSGFGSDWSSRGANPPERRSSWCEGSRIPEFRSAAATHRPSQTSTPLSSDWLRSMRGGLELGRSRPGASGAWDFDAEKLRSKAASRLSSSTGAFSAPWQEENSSPPWAEKSAAPEAPSFSARTERVERDRARPGASQPFGLRQEQRRPAQAPVPPREAPREAALRERVQPGAPAPPSAPPEPGRIRQSPRNRMRAGPYMTQEALVQPCKGHPESGASSRAASTPSSPPESPSEGESGSSGSNLSRPNSSVSSQMRAKAEESDSAQSQPVSLPLALVPCEEKCFGACTAKRKESSGSLLRKRRSTLGLLQQDTAEPLRSSGRRGKVPDQWMPPLDASTGGLERSELGLEATSEVRRWLLGQTSGQQCSQVILDRALTVLSNFKLASGCDLEVLGGDDCSPFFYLRPHTFRMHSAGHSRLAVLSLCTRPKEPEAPKSSRVVCSLAGALTAKLFGAMEDDFATLLLSLEACHFRQVHRLQAELRREVSRSASADADRHATAACEGRNGVMGGEAAGDALQMKKELDPPWPNTPGHSPRAKSEKNDFFLKKSSTAFRWKGSKNKYLADMLKHPLCDCTMSFLIVVNAIIFAFEAQYKGFDLGNELGLRQEGAHLLWPGATEAFEVAELTFGIIFSLEVVLRLWVERLKFFCDGWNLLDFVVVLVWALGRAWQGLPVNSQILRLGRLFRLLRMLRLVRKIKEFDALFLMTTAIRSSFMVLGWTIMLLFLCQMLFALVVQQILFGFYFDPSNLEILDDQREVYMYFGTFSRALLSLFEMTLANWPPVCRMLMESVSEWWMPFC
ncbi:unnamed protein product, partial [Effrenium voratum]